MTIKAKILCLVAAFALLAAAITALSLKTMADYSHAIADYRHASENAFRGERLNRYLTAAALEGRGVYMARNEKDAHIAADLVDTRANALVAFVNDWNTRLKPGELPEFAEVRGYVLELARDGHVLADTTRNSGIKAANDYGNHAQYRLARERIQARIDRMVGRITAAQTRSQAELTQFASQRQLQFLLISGAGILLLLVASMWIAIASIARPLTSIRRSMVKVSEGIYDTPIPDAPAGSEIGELCGALEILKVRAAEAERLTKAKLEEEHRLRELVLD